ncbi:MAG: DegT/DnrJ/EryC1/StrS family aminotransferase [Planctomycetota bacterium]
MKTENVVKRNIPLCIPDMGEDEISAVTAVLKYGWLAHGPMNHEFENLFATYIGVPHAVGAHNYSPLQRIRDWYAG